MITYLTYVISPLLVAFFICFLTGKRISTVPKNRKYYLWLCGIIMVFVIGLRHYSNGSGDSYFYYRQWEAMSAMSLRETVIYCLRTDMEIGFLACEGILSHIFKNPQFAFILSGLFFAVSLCLFVHRNSENVVLPLLIFNCLGLFNFMVQGMRQGIAICICLFAIESCKTRKPIRFFLQIALAMLFHASAIIFLPVYWLYALRLDWKSAMIFAGGCVLGWLLLPWLIDIVNFFMNESYAISTGTKDGSGVVAIVIYLFIISFGLFTAYVGHVKGTQNCFIYMAIFGMIALVMRNTISNIAERANHYYVCSQMAIIPMGLQRIQKGPSRMILTGIIVFLCIGVAVYKASYSVLIPYLFCWQ